MFQWWFFIESEKSLFHCEISCSYVWDKEKIHIEIDCGVLVISCPERKQNI